MAAAKRRNADHSGRLTITQDLHDALVIYGLGQPESPVKLMTLSAQEALTTRAIRNARVILGGIAAEPQRLTEKLKLLNRRFVALMLEQLEVDGSTQEYLGYSRVVDEDSVWTLMMLRHALQYGGLIRVRSGKLQVTSRGRELQAVERAGELYGVILEALLTRVNLAMRDGYPEDSAMQDHIPFALFRLGTSIREPLPLFAFADRMPHDEDVWSSEPISGELLGLHAMRALHGGLTVRILRPLQEFGLIDCEQDASGSGFPRRGCSREELASWFNRHGDRCWNLTPLFDHVIALEVDGRLVSLEQVDTPQPVVTLFPPECVMSLEEAIGTFTEIAIQQEGLSAEVVGLAMTMLEIAVVSDTDEYADETPVEQAIVKMPMVVRMNVKRVDSIKHAALVALFSAVFSAFARWAEEIGQARYRISRSALMRLEPLDILDAENSAYPGVVGEFGAPWLN